MQVLVTGGSGFVGSELKKSIYLDDPFPVYPSSEELDITNWFLVNEYFERVRPDVVIHLAGQTNIGQSAIHPHLDLDINAKGMINLVCAAEEYEVSKFIYMSTCAVYGNCMFMKEDEQPFPESPYGISKLAAEQYLRIADIKVKTVLRLSNALGYNSHLTPRITDIFSDCLEKFESPVFFGTGKDTYRDYIHTDDVCNAIKMMMFKDFRGTFNLCTGVPTNLSTLWGMMQSIWGIDGQEPIYQELRDCDALWAVPSSDKIQEVCGFEFKHDLYSGLKKIYDTAQNNKSS